MEAERGRVRHLQFREITFEEMETLLHGFPFYIILSVVIQGIRGSPPSSGTSLRKESLEAKFKFSLFSEVERVYLGVRRLSVKLGMDT
jgi:hypothetical protein